jgi:hypothetical protein
MSQIDSTKKVYLIVHGQRQLVEPVKDKLADKFKRENMQPASKEIVVSQITGTGGSGGQGMGAWSSVSQKELFRVSL